jgi:hypothetical protein
MVIQFDFPVLCLLAENRDRGRIPDEGEEDQRRIGESDE